MLRVDNAASQLPLLALLGRVLVGHAATDSEAIAVVPDTKAAFSVRDRMSYFSVSLSSILLLDEATSALDAESETRIGLALDRGVEGRTTLIIADRLATVQRAKHILVMHEGRIAEL